MKNCKKNGGFDATRLTAPAADSVDPRETMRVLPRLLQPVLTAITGKPLPEEEPLVSWTGAGRFWQVTAGMTLGVAASAAAWTVGGPAVALIPGTWLLTVWGARSIQTTIIHHASHGTLFRSEKWNAWVSEALSTLIWILPFSDYKKGHLPHHAATATSRDVDLLFLKGLGFRPGMSVPEYWRQLGRMILAPSFHGSYLAARLRSNFITASRARRWMAIAWTLVAAALVAAAPGLALMAYLIPVFPLYHVAGLLQLLTEHSWVRIGARVNSVKYMLSRVTTGRFMGAPVPEIVRERGGGLRRWFALTGWIVGMLFRHLPARLFVVQGDLTNHDYHHRNPGSKGWANAAFARRDDAHGELHGWLPYDEVWGLGAALNLTFTRLSQLPADTELGEPLTYGEIADVKLTM